MKWIPDGTQWELGKIRAPDGIWTHDPPKSIWILCCERGRIVNIWLELHQAATESNNNWQHSSYLHHAVTFKHIRDAANQLHLI